jgi:pimeloyl-ACP methyl ester carboxylesterase
MTPDTKYTKAGDINIAYQVFGSGSIDLVIVPGWLSNIDIFWDEPRCVRFFQRLASFSRVIIFDKRGTGLSDRVTNTPTLEERMEDVHAVMDAAGSKQASLFGYSEGGPMCALFSATYPERTLSLILVGSYARRIRTEDFPWGVEESKFEEFFEDISKNWGGPVGLAQRAPSVAADKFFGRWWAKFLRMSASPAAAVALTRMNREIDIRGILHAIRVPTLVLHAQGDRLIKFEQGRFLAEKIPGAKLILLPTEDHLPWIGCPDILLDRVEEFLTGIRTRPSIDRVFCTVMFTDIVASTKIALTLGDQRFHDLLEAYRKAIRLELSIYKGRELDTAGDGFYVMFDGPARAIHCARAIRDSLRALELPVRIGLHTGECQIDGKKFSGITAHIGARITAKAYADQILVSHTVKDLVAGSGIEFKDFGVHALEGIPDKWHLYSVV